MGRSRQLLVALTCVVSAFIVLRATTRGVGLSPDSLQYLAAAESAASGHGLTTRAWDGAPQALTHYPPGYPLFLAAGIRLGASPESFARYANVALLVFTLILVTVLAQRLVPDPPWAAPAAAIACGFAHDFLVIHSMAWSEPLYLTLTVAGIVALSEAVERQSATWLVLSALAAAAAALVRYVGVANVALVALVTLCWWPVSAWKRIRLAGAVSLVAALPLFGILVFGARRGSAGIANRKLVWHPIGFEDVRIAAGVMGKWITPLSDATFLSVVWLAALGLFVAIMLTRRARRVVLSDLRPASRRLAGILVLYAASYVTVLVLAMTLVDAQTTFEPRMLSPLLAVAIILGVAWLARQTRAGGFVRFATAAILGLVIGANVLRFFPWQREARRYGLALRRLDREGEALVIATRQLPAAAQIYSNDPYFLRVQTSRTAAGIPRELDPNSLLPNAQHAKQVRDICDSAARRPTFIVLFDRPMSGDSTARALAAEKSGDVDRVEGGAIIRVRPRCAG